MKKKSLGEEIRGTQKKGRPVKIAKPVLGKYITGQEDPKKRDYLNRVSKLRKILLLINSIIVFIVLLYLLSRR